MSLSISWSEPTLCTYNNDISKQWFVYFTIVNDLTGQKKQPQFRGGINYYHTIEDRTRLGNALVQHWRDHLNKGLYNPWMDPDAPVMHNEMPGTLKEGLAKILALKKSALKWKSFRNYRQVHNMFVEWLDSQGYGSLRLYQFTPKLAQGYFDYLLLEKEYSGKTHNNQHGILMAFFSEMASETRKWIDKNPLKGIKMLPENQGSNYPYTDEEAEVIIRHLRENDLRMYYTVNWVFHGFIRKTELTTIRVRDINWENRTIRINSDAAKNRTQDSVTIPEELYQVMIEMGLNRAPKQFYVFGRGMETCADRLTRPDDISDRYLEHKIQLGYEAGDDRTFYSWKHSGVIAYWNLLKDPYAIMRQCRHADLKTTLIYLKSLGLNPNAPFLQASATLGKPSSRVA